MSPGVDCGESGGGDLQADHDGFYLECLKFEVCEPSRLRRPVRYPRGAYLKKCIWQVPGDTVGMNEITWKNGTHSGAQSGAGGNSSGRPHNHLCRNSQLIQ